MHGQTHTHWGRLILMVLVVLGILTMCSTAVSSARAQEAGEAAPDAAVEEMAEAEVKDPMIVHLHLAGMMSEQPIEDPFGMSGGQGPSLRGLTDRLAKLAEDDDATGGADTLGPLGAGRALLEELHDALQRVRDAGKPVYLFTESMGTAQYAMLGNADHVVMPPQSILWTIGYYGEALYVKDLLDKIGVHGDFLTIAEYKSAAEMITRSGPSEPADENLNWLFDSWYETTLDRVAEHRGMSATRVRALIDGGPYSAEEAVEAGLIDAVATREQFVERVKAEVAAAHEGEPWVQNRYREEGSKANFANPFALFSSLFAKPQRDEDAKPAIGIVYVEGTIQPGHGQPNPFGGSQGAFSGDITHALDMAAEDDNVEAVVLRVDSPGGSAQASEAILNAVLRVREHKPVVVSMGNVAGSGGYYVACRADEIVADPMTVTGSIGVVAGKLVTTEMWNHLGINWHPYRRGQNADFFASKEDFRDGQRQKLDQWMHEVYGVFIAHVEAGRGDKLGAPLDELAGGRVYTGRQALENGLVDALGGLRFAIERAAEHAGLDDYDTRVIPRPKDFFTQLVEESSGIGERPSDLSLALRGLKDSPFAADAALPWLSMLESLDPARAAALRESIAALTLVHRDRVALVMPFTVVVPSP